MRGSCDAPRSVSVEAALPSLKEVMTVSASLKVHLQSEPARSQVACGSLPVAHPLGVNLNYADQQTTSQQEQTVWLVSPCNYVSAGRSTFLVVKSHG